MNNVQKFLILLLLIVTDASQSVAEDNQTKALKSVIKKTEPSIVAIIVSHSTRYENRIDPLKPWLLGSYQSNPLSIKPFERDRLDLSDGRNASDHTCGTGIVLSENGLVLTTYHVIEGARKIYLRFSDGTGSYADIHAYDARADLAVLKAQYLASNAIEPIKFTSIDEVTKPTTSEYRFQRGEPIVAIAHPHASGLTDGKVSVSAGIISSVRRRQYDLQPEPIRHGMLYQYRSLIQTDIKTTTGSSGGALVNMSGECIGLVSSLASVSGAESSGGFAIPIDGIYRNIINTLKDGKEVEYGFLGVTPGQLSSNPLRPGLRIGNVSPTMPASIAGLQSGDILTTIDRQPILEIDDLFLHIGGSLADETVELGIYRGNLPIRYLNVRLTKMFHALPTLASVTSKNHFGIQVEYSSILYQQQLGRIAFASDGVLIRDVEKGSSAELALQNYNQSTRWLITHVDNQKVLSPKDYEKSMMSKSTVVLTLKSTIDRSEPSIRITLAQ